jgi:transcriptional regulator with XRE-family HTH domain
MTGERLRKIREALGHSKAAMARELGISRNSLAKYESARRVRKLVALAAEALEFKGRNL